MVRARGFSKASLFFIPCSHLSGSWTILFLFSVFLLECVGPLFICFRVVFESGKYFGYKTFSPVDMDFPLACGPCPLYMRRVIKFCIFLFFFLISRSGMCAWSTQIRYLRRKSLFRTEHFHMKLSLFCGKTENWWWVVLQFAVPVWCERDLWTCPHCFHVLLNSWIRQPLSQWLLGCASQSTEIEKFLFRYETHTSLLFSRLGYGNGMFIS